MAASVTVLWLVAAFLGGAFSLTCFHCSTATGDCNVNEKPCLAPQDTCITTLTEIQQDKPKLPIKQLVKLCGEKKFCNQSYSMSFNSTKLYASNTCCDKDKCKTNMPLIEDPKKEKDKENTLSCPFCIESPTTKCNDGDTAKCYGKEDKCVSFTAKEVNSSKISKWKGCATTNVCSMSTVATLPISHVGPIKFDCSHAPSLLPGLLLPVAFGPAMLKLLL
ncbi:phospholipase A2 inhibitor subunit gamma B-like [Rana temporaria]|uniref:phospholipase A2 inhibitor subunit gamma B-like n=1 Tax=Rana temporaria TaxID=8407 RepID=UPI001AACC02C|nr:phospholipase A2 inhibitor subunit gamma B-like [Rana temporaria]